MRTLLNSGISKVKVNNTLKTAELELAVHIACHSSIRTIDHLDVQVKKKKFLQGYITA